MGGPLSLANLLEGSLGSLASAIVGGLVSLWIAKYVLTNTLRDQRQLLQQQLKEQRTILLEEMAHQERQARTQREVERVRALTDAARSAGLEAANLLGAWIAATTTPKGHNLDLDRITLATADIGRSLVALMPRLRNLGAITATQRAVDVLSLLLKAIQEHSQPRIFGRERPPVHVDFNLVHGYIQDLQFKLTSFAAGLPSAPVQPPPSGLLGLCEAFGLAGQDCQIPEIEDLVWIRPLVDTGVDIELLLSDPAIVTT